MALRTVEQLKEYFAERKRINQRKQEKAKERKLKQQELQKRRREFAKALKDSKLEEKPKELPQFTFQVNGSNIIARENREDALYTMYELQHIENLYPEESGRINWSVWEELSNKLQKEFEELAKKQRKKEYNAIWRAEHSEYLKEYKAEYNKTPMGRAVYLVNSYQKADKKYNRGECTLTAQWIIDNIFNKPCHYCGETDWRKMGCDRIDNSLPHTPENVVPCCFECNSKRGRKSYEEFKASLQQQKTGGKIKGD